VVGLFEDLLCSETYWAYIPGIQHTDSFPALHRPYPQRVAGELVGYRYAPDEKRFTCTWHAVPDCNASSRIYLPDWFGFKSDNVTLTPPGPGFQVHPLQPGVGNLLLEIPLAAGVVLRRLEVRQA